MEKNIIYSSETVTPQIELLTEKYPAMEVMHADSCSVQLHGRLHIHRSYQGFVLNRTYTVDIHIPLNSNQLPFVIDTEGAISPTYPHRYPDGVLCLETDAQIRMRFIDGFDLSAWVFEFVEVYYLSYEYYNRYGEFPFGERAHGYVGVLQSFQEHLSANDLVTTYKLMRYIVGRPYRGHAPCPCGSNLKLRNCHGQSALKFYRDDRLRRILQHEIESIEKELKSNHEQHNNQRTSK